MYLKVAERIRIGYLTAVIVLFIAFLLNFYTSRQLIHQASQVNHTTDVMNNLEFFVSYIKDGETGTRGYLLMNDEMFLQPYYESHANADSMLRNLKNITRGDETQQRTLDSLKDLTNQRYALLAFAINAFKANNYQLPDSVRRKSYAGKALTDSIRNVVKRMQQRELVIMQTPSKKIGDYSSILRVINTTSLMIAIFIAIYSIITYNRENKLKEEANTKADNYRTELETRVEQLNKLNKELVELKSLEKFTSTGRIARTIAHEVRNPLTNITLASEQLRNEIPLNDETSVLLGMIERNSGRINQLITELLNSTKFAQLEYSKVSINKILDDALNLAKDRFDLNSIKLIKNYTSDICDITVDIEKIKIAFLNIIVNAIEAVESGTGVIRIRTESRHSQCMVTISDNGKGMNEETLSRLFEPYFTGKQKGTGLGLTHTQNIILNHKGSITVESELNRGTTFVVSLNFD